jgi:hypothetical protein
MFENRNARNRQQTRQFIGGQGMIGAFHAVSQ